MCWLRMVGLQQASGCTSHTSKPIGFTHSYVLLDCLLHAACRELVVVRGDCCNGRLVGARDKGTTTYLQALDSLGEEGTHRDNRQAAASAKFGVDLAEGVDLV